MPPDPSSNPKKGRNGQILSMSERLKVLEIYNDFSNTMNKTKAVAACSKQTKRSQRIIWKLVKEQTAGQIIPAKRHKKPHMKSHCRLLKYNSDVRSLLRRIVHSCMIFHVFPKLDTVVAAFNACSFDTIRRNTMYNLLRETGFRSKNFNVNGSKTSMFSETTSIIDVRHKYLDTIKLSLSQNRPIVYCGELFVSNGEDFNVLLLAGCEDGIIAAESLPVSTKKEDPRMPHEDFEAWFADRVLPQCPPGALVVLDERDYHWRREKPERHWTRNDLLEWFQNGRIIANMQLTTESLYKMALDTANCGRFIIEVSAKQLNIEVLQLPPNHPELTPLTTIFNHIRNISKLVKNLQKAWDAVNGSAWNSAVQDVRDNETLLRTVDCMQKDLVELAERMTPCRPEDVEKIVSLQLFDVRKKGEGGGNVFVIKIVEEEEDEDEKIDV